MRGLFALVFISGQLMAQQVPEGFTVQEIVRGLDPTHMALAPDGRLFIAEKGGEVSIINNDVLQEQPFLSIEVDNYNERGLSGIVFDPDFESNNYFYVYYTVPGVNYNRISRFTANGDFAIPGSEEVLMDLDVLAGTIHNGGAMLFGPDGKLYVAVGDGADGNNAQDLNNLLGKILRLNADGSIPTDNPYYTELSGNNRAIYAYGLRNPFSLAIDPKTGRIFANDVGQATWEEVNDIQMGSNYGWPIIEGPIAGQAPPENYEDPLYAYTHDEGCAIVGASFYAPEFNQFPEEYIDKYFFADYCGGYIKVLDPDSGETQSTFANNINRPLSILFTPDGTMYFLERAGQGGGSEGDNTSSEDGALWKVVYTGSGQPFIGRQPESVLIPVGEDATFSVLASGASVLEYQWQKNGVDIDGANDNTYTFTNGQLADDGTTFKCIVSNDLGTASSEEATLSVTDNTRPVPQIISPQAGDNYRGGDLIEFMGVANDEEDGVLDETRFSWKIDFHHNTHSHPAMGENVGVESGTYEIPRIGETSDNVWYRIYLTVEDLEGLTQTTYTDIFPLKSSITVNSEPPGLTVSLDGQQVVTPYSTIGVEGITRTIEAIQSQEFEDELYVFDAWQDESTELIRSFNTPENDTTIYLDYVNVQYGTGTGLYGAYYSDQTKTFNGNPNLFRLDPTIDFNWAENSPFNEEVSPDNFTVKWQGYVQPLFGGEHAFHTVTDDGVRLWVNGDLIIDKWVDQATTEWTGTVFLEAGELYDIKMEYYELGGEAVAQLWWSNALISKQIIPISQLYSYEILSVDSDYKSLHIYPNPAENYLFITTENTVNRLWITDLNGRYKVVKDVNNQSEMILETHTWQKGMYLVYFKMSNGEIISKVIAKI